jgi:hypothetical protein
MTTAASSDQGREEPEVRWGIALANRDEFGRSSMVRTALALATAVFLLSACGASQGDRALSGAGIGAAAGAAGSGLTGGSILGGALLGGAAGGAAGALTDEDDIDLGEPVWK